jgi:hypothetical protein
MSQVKSKCDVPSGTIQSKKLMKYAQLFITQNSL